MAETTLGERFATALAVKDFDTIKQLFAEDVDFRGLTPRRNWEAASPEAVVGGILVQWFEPEDEIVSLEQLETDSFADRERVGYRFRVTNPDGEFLVEQQAYLGSGEGRIDWMRVVCSGFRPADGD